MSLAATSVWEVRSAGSSGNGGFFNAANVSAGTDYSQQDAAQVSVTDGVTNGTTTVTSATANFTAAMAGNGIKIAAAWYEIVSVSNATTIIVDRTITAGSGRTMKVGGAIDLHTTVDTVAVAGNTFWFKGAFTITSTKNYATAGVDNAPQTFLGYTTTRGDNGLAVFTASGMSGGSSVLQWSGSFTQIANIKVDGVSLDVVGINLSAGAQLALNCWAKDCTWVGIAANNDFNLLLACKATGCGSAISTGKGIALGRFGLAVDCAATGNSGDGFASDNVGCSYLRCLATGNRHGFAVNGSGSPYLFQCTSDGNTGSGLYIKDNNGATILTAINNLFSNNGAYGINSNTTDYSVAANAQSGTLRLRNNAFYNNASGATHNIPASTSPFTLTADPYNNRSGSDFSLGGNTAASALRGTGFATHLGLLTSPEVTASYMDIGVAQGQSTVSSAILTDMRSLWRELTGEKDTEVAPDATVDIYIQRGLEALNRVAKFYIKTDTSSVVLVDGTQEYTLPTDVVEIMWVRWNSADLKHEDVELWRQYEDEWSAEKSAPTAWAHEGNRIIFRPIPNAAAVATAASPRFRYVAKPPSVTTSGFDQLNEQDAPVAVYWGVYLWSQCYPDSAVASARAKTMQDIFEAESQRIAADYQRRQTGR